MTRIIGVIPARMGSWRFPGKPLANILGRPMLEHVYRRTAASSVLDEVVIATCDEEIVQASQQFGARAIMTSSTHERASDRVAEAVEEDSAEIVVMVQGDEPMVRPEMISVAVKPMVENADIDCVNLAAVIDSEEELADRNTIKAVISQKGRALYFSREPIPATHDTPFTEGKWYKQVCIIPFRKGALMRFRTLPPGPLEIAESIDMLRYLEHDISVHMAMTETKTHAVDTPSDLKLVESLMVGEDWESYFDEG